MSERFLRRAAVEQATGLKRSAIYDLMARGQFPKPIRITDGRAVGWLESEITAYQQARIAKARKSADLCPQTSQRWRRVRQTRLGSAASAPSAASRQQLKEGL